MLALFPILFPILAGACVWLLPSLSRRLRNLITAGTLSLCVLSSVLLCVYPGERFMLFRVTGNVDFALRADGTGLFFLVLMNEVWLLAALYSFEYMAHQGDERRYYAFCLMAPGALSGLCLSANLVTFYLFYECMTLLTLPLVLHNKTREAVAAGVKYLIYSLFGASVALYGIFYLAKYNALEFAAGGAALSGADGALVTVIFLMILGFGTKAGMFPLQGWLPTAHPAAPAPASAVLSGVITKAGVLGVIRVVFYIAGADILRGSWAQTAWMALALLTIVLGSSLAFEERHLKRRLAYSTVSQVSYILFGLSTLTPLGFVGALTHCVAHSLSKDALFMAAGSYILKTGKTDARDLRGIGRAMPGVTLCFLFASLTLIGVPPMIGFMSKWNVAEGALALPSFFSWLGPAVLLLSALLTAGYLLPIPIYGFFPAGETEYKERLPVKFLTLLPMVILCALCLLFGLFSGELTRFFTALAAGVMA